MTLFCSITINHFMSYREIKYLLLVVVFLIIIINNIIFITCINNVYTNCLFMVVCVWYGSS